MSAILYIWGRTVGFHNFLKLYFVPYIVSRHCIWDNICPSNVDRTLQQLANHWIVMLTYLHHSDPTIPHFRNKQWSFLRGAVSTVDRPLLGWIGRFFLHNVSHDHVSFYFLPKS